MLAVLSIAGTAGNALVLCVFARRKDSLVSTVYIISLAVVDFTTCLVIVPFTIYMENVNFCIDSDVVCKVLVAVHFIVALLQSQTHNVKLPTCADNITMQRWRHQSLSTDQQHQQHSCYYKLEERGREINKNTQSV